MGLLQTALAPKMAGHSGKYAPSHNMRSIFDHYKSEAYTSAYPSIRAIASEYMQVRPFAIDGNGKTVKQSNIVDALYHPNQLDSSVAFFEKIAVSTLFHRKTYLLVWSRTGATLTPGGNFGVKGRNIAGFTFLEYPAVTRRDGRTFYGVGADEFSDAEVIVLPGGVDPTSLYSGYSPSEAVRKWAKLDDYIADFQSGFFENGAVPAGLITVAAKTDTEFHDIVDTIEARHRGAGQNSKVTFAHRPIDNTGKPVDAQIQWTPFSQNNKDIDFKNLFEQTNKRIDLSYGVAQIIKGVDDAATYANAQVAEKGFAKRAVYPLLLRNYTQINHELNRITNGTGIALTFKYDIPLVADEEKVEAETKAIEGQVIRDMITAGFSLESIVESFNLSNSYKNLKIDTSTQTKIENDKPDVDEGGEVADSPDPSKVDSIQPRNEVQTSPKLQSDEDKLEDVARTYMQTQIDRVVQEYADEPENAVQPEPEEDELNVFVAAMVVLITAILLSKGEEEYAAGIALVSGLGIDTSTLTQFNLTEGAIDGYRAYIRRVGESYGQDTAISIRGVLARADEFGFTRKETENALKQIMQTDDWRIQRLARTELNRSQAIASVESMKQIQAETGVQFEKSLFHSNGAECEYCKALEGVWVAVDQPLLSLGDSIIGTDGGILVNDFTDNEGYDPHPNGKGVAIYRRAE